MSSGASLDIGVAAHITAASPGGPRYDATLSAPERIAAGNGLWLCQNCAKLVDNDRARYTVQLLRTWKLQAEEAALRNIGRPESITQVEREVRLRFRAAFMPALADLGGAKVDPFHILSVLRSAHDAAIIEYQSYVADPLKASYENAVARFRAVREDTQPGIISFYQLEVTGTTTGAKVEQIISAIEQLLSFTESVSASAV